MYLCPAEIAIVATDLAELLGSAIALSMIFPKLPLWAGVILTSLDVLVILALNDSGKGRPVRLFEIIIVVLVRVFCVFSAMKSCPIFRPNLGPCCIDMFRHAHCQSQSQLA